MNSSSVRKMSSSCEHCNVKLEELLELFLVTNPDGTGTFNIPLVDGELSNVLVLEEVIEPTNVDPTRFMFK